MPPLLTIPEAARQLKCCARVVHRLIDDGKLPVVQITDSKRGRRINAIDLANFTQGKKCQSDSTAANGLSISETGKITSELDELLGLAEKASNSKPRYAAKSSAKRSLTLVSNKHSPNI